MEKETKKPTEAKPYVPHLFEKQGGWFTYQDVYDRFALDILDGGTFVEIGFYCGRSFLYFLERLKNLNKKAETFAIDPFIKDVAFGNLDLNESKELIKAAGFSTNFIAKKSQDCADNFANESIDVLFIDGDHSYEACKQDLALYYPKVKRGGWIGVHDYFNIGDVSRAIDEFTNANLVGKPNKVYVHYEREYLGSKTEIHNATHIGTFYFRKP